MSRRLTRRQAGLGLAALLPALTALLVLRPVPAHGNDPALGFFALTVTAATTNTTGDIGAGGGLTPIDTGAPVVKGRLDSSPTASMIAAAVEPGTLYRTVAALANNEVGDELVPVEFAEAAYPGGPDEDVSDPTATGVQGPFASGTVQARAEATERAITGAARVGEQAVGAGDVPIRDSLALLRDGLGQLALRFPTAVRLPGSQPDLLRHQVGQAEAAATGDPVAGTLVASASSTAATVSIAGLITIDDVRGHAVVRLEDGEVTADAATTHGGVTVGGVPVALTTDGVVVAEDVPLPLQEAAVLEDQLNAVLEAAGIQIAPLSPIEKAGGGDAVADSGGIRMSITTPSSAAVPANVVDITIGQAVATLAAEAPLPPPAPLPGSPTGDAPTTPPGPGTPAPHTDPSSAAAPPPGTPVTRPPASAPSAPAPPRVAAPLGEPTTSEPEMVLAGRRVPRRTALALFGGWQLLSLSTCTLAAFALRGGGGRP